MLALTALSHIIFGYVAFLSIAIWALAMPGDGRARRLARAASIAGRTMLLLAWFVVPMMLAGADINRSRWEAAYKFDSYGAPMILSELFSGRLLDFGRLPLLSLMVALGALLAAFKIRDSLARRLLVLAGFWLALFFGRETWGHLLVLVGASADLPVHRLQAAFELFAILLAGWGLERMITAAIRAPRLLAVAAGVIVGGAIVVIGVERAEYLRFNATWGAQNLAAFQHARGDLELSVADLRAILAQRPGRVSAGKAAEWSNTFTVGSAKGYSLLTRYGLDQASFLYHSMSLTSDYMVLRNENDPVDQQLFGIRAVLAPASLKAPSYFLRRSVHGPFAVYETSLEGYFGLIDIAARYVGPAATWFDPVSAWLRSGLPRVGEVIALDPHFDGVPAIKRWQPLPDPAPQFRLPRGQILSESKTAEIYRASIDVQRPCYALVKITWFPGLMARVDGQRTPLVRVTPDFGAVPLTPGHHEVEVRYQPGPLKPLLFLAGIVLFVLAARPSLGAYWERGEQWLQERLALWDEWLTTDRAKIALALALLFLLFTRGLFRGQLVSGHDSMVYPARVPEFAKVLSDHQFPPMWAPDLSSGHGQPLFEFAPPLVYAAALPFFKCGMNLADSLQFGLVLLFAMGALAVYLLGRKMSFPPIASLGAAAAWLFAPYQALDLYVRAAFAEAAAVAIAPVALLGLMTALERPTLLNAALGALAIALVLLAHNAVALLLFPVFAAIVAARSIRSGRPLRTVAAGGAAIAGGLGLSAFFWLPALLEKDFVKTELLRIWQIHIISPLQLLWGHWGFGLSIAGPNDGMSFSIGLVHIALAIAGILIGVRALSRTRRLDAMVFAGAALVGALLATEWSAPIWTRVTTLQYLAYPWRTLFLPALFTPLLALFVFERVGPRASVALIALIVLINLSHTQPKGYLTFDDEFYYPVSIANMGYETTTHGEYVPRWVQQPAPHAADGLLNASLWQSVRELSRTSTSHEYSAVARNPMIAIDSTNYYPGWTVSIDGQETGITPAPISGLISFMAPAGSHIIRVQLRPTTVRRRAFVLSLLTLAALLLAVVAAYVDRALSLGMARPAPSIEPESTGEPESTEPGRLSAATARFLRRAEEVVASLAPATRARLTVVAGILLLMVFVGQGLMFMRANSQAFDEAIYLVSGYSYLSTHQFRLIPHDAPLMPELIALPVYLWYRLPFNPSPEIWNRPDSHFYGETFGPWVLGRDFLYGSSVPADRLLALSRIPILVLGTILVALVGWWSYRLWGPWAGIVAMWLAALDPNLIANSSVATSDLGPTLFSFLTMYLLWEYTACASAWLLMATGISLGLALVSKFSTLLLFGILAMVVAADSLPLPGAKRTDEAVKGFAAKLLHGTAAAVLISLVAALVISLVYFGIRQGISTVIAGLHQLLTLEGQGKPGFLLGKYSSTGWWSYFLVVVLIKTPVGTLLLIFASLIFYRAGARLSRRDAIFLLVPAAAFIAAASLGKIDIGLRYILPIYPFLFVLASRLTTIKFRRAWVMAVVCGLPLMMTAVSSLSVAPHQLAYFNELVGGPGNGYRYLSDSDIDWGQDLKGLKTYMKRNRLTWIYLSYFGTAPPSYYGINYQYAPGAYTLECCPGFPQPPGARDILAVSVVNLQDVMAGGRSHFYDWLYKRTPIAKVGYSIYLYDITGDAQAHLKLADAYLRAGGLLPMAISEAGKALALDSSNPDVRRMASSLHPSAAKPLSTPPSP